MIFRSFSLRFHLVLSSLIENDYPTLEIQYEKLKDLRCPALFLWGRDDRVGRRI